MIPVVQPKPDTHWLPLTGKTGMAARGRLVTGYSQEASGDPSRESHMSAEVVTHICVPEAHKWNF